MILDHWAVGNRVARREHVDMRAPIAGLFAWPPSSRALGGLDQGGAAERVTRRGVYAMAANHGLFGVVPALLTLFTLMLCIRGHIFAFDFHHAYWTAAHALLTGVSPYVSTHARAVTNNTAFIYPALAAILLTPLALLPHAVGDGLFTGLVIVAALGHCLAPTLRSSCFEGVNR
jgi:hypothetical protein